MTELTPKTFTHTIIEDVIAASQRLDGNDTPCHRRDLVRTVFAAIEGLHWQLKQDVLRHPSAELSIHEHAALAEETYALDDRGNVNVIPRFLPLANTMRLAVQMVQRYRPTYKVDYGHQGWANLKAAIEIRNRLVHPKTLEDLLVNDRDLQTTISEFYWVLALVIEVFKDNVKDLKETREALKAYLDDHR